jgi:surface protein
VTDMSVLFGNSKFNGDISNWDVSNVTDMDYMFVESKFNGDISNWGLSSKIYRDENGTIKCHKPLGIGFIGEIDGVSYKVVDSQMLSTMIKNNEDLRFICTTKITDMSGMFYDSQFNGDISNWDVSNVTNMSVMFEYSQFNGDISNWDVSNVRDCRSFRTNTSWTLPIPIFTNCNPNLIFEEEEIEGDY